MAIMAKSMGEVTYKDISSLHKWALLILISMGSSIIYAPMYLKNVFYDPLMQALGCTNADLGMMVSAYGLAAMICYLPSGIIADKVRMRTLATVGFLATAVLVFVYATLPSVGVCLALFVAMGVTSILIWWGTRFKVVRLCCEEEEYASKIGISYSIYGVTGLVIGLINAAIIAALSNTLGVAAGVQVMIIFLGVIIAILGVLSFSSFPISRARSTRMLSSSASLRQSKLSSILALSGHASLTSAYTLYTRAQPTPRLTSPSASVLTATSLTL